MADAGASRIHDSILTLVGRTPMVRLRKLARTAADHPTDPPSKGARALGEVVAKLESFNPAGSVKDRASLAMIEAAEREGRLEPGDILVEPTSGNTGIGLALVAAVKGYRLVVVLPDDTPKERQSVLRNYGAQVVLTPAAELMQGAISRAKRIVEDNPRCRLLQQFENAANPEVHRRTTALEILEDCGGKLDAFVCGIGTGGTISGVGSVLKKEIPAIKVIGVEPEGSAILSGKTPRQHTIWGIGAGFVPPILDRSVLDEVMTCRDSVAYEVAYRLAREEGISAGVSAGAATFCALRVAHRLGPGSRTVVLLADGWDRYTSADSTNVGANPAFVI